jgi:hypothetical protein
VLADVAGHDAISGRIAKSYAAVRKGAIDWSRVSSQAYLAARNG